LIEYNDTLNPILWDGFNIKAEIKEKLLEIYTTFKQQVLDNNIPLDIIDVLLLGSNASFNYTKNSDIDLHLVVDFNDISIDSTLVQVLYNSEKSTFNSNHNITIKGLPVEVYIEDINAGTQSNGIFSLLQNKWLRLPEYNPPEDVNIEQLLNHYNTLVQEALLSNSPEKIKHLINDIRMLRKISLNANGEYSKGNLVFKELRNNGDIQKLYDTLADLTSSQLSLENNKRTLSEVK